MDNIAISVEHVKKIYKLYDRNRDRLKDALGFSKKPLGKEHYALNDVSFQVGQGETVGIIGTNGSGKSTILKIITGVLNPTDGEVKVNGRISALLELGAGFNMEYTGIENIYLNGTMIGFTKEEIDEKLQDILDFADIGDFVNQPVKTYSSGMFVRLAFAVAINIEPEILIVDEALSVGDVFFQTKCYHKFEEFKKIPEIVKKNNRANFKLMNTIFGNGKTMTESIGSADNPYNGTFDGQGYYVYRFDIKSSDGNAALFDTIGARGSVKNFAAFYQNIEGEKAAGLAIVNYGLIDECISGSNLSGPFTDQLTHEPKNLTETTTFVKGTSMAGGVVVENKGVIRNTANYAKATASASDGIAGGIAVVNSGTIENCMSIGALSTKENGIAGGIVGKLDKNGSIQIAYSAQTAIEGGTTGAVFGAKEETAGAVNNTYYQDTLSGNEEQGTAKTAAEMKSNAFKEELNTLVAGNEELCSWTWNSTKNQGYPRILSSLITEVELVNASRGLTVKGMMHKDTKLQLNELDKKNDIYQAFKKYAQKTDKQVLYSAESTLVYEDGQPSAYEGNLNVKLDLSKYRGKGYKVLVYRNNQIEELEIDKQMIASKDVEEMVPFAVLAEKSELSKAVDHIKDTVKTGDNSSVILLRCIVVVAGSVAGGVIYWRKKKARK
mgnify:CR=1 FL=1